MARRPPAKADLPEKICASCGRRFSWRRKWAKVWPLVRYCSERCRRHRPRPDMAAGSFARSDRTDAN